MSSPMVKYAWLKETLQHLRTMRVCEVAAGPPRGAMFLLGFGHSSIGSLRRYRATHSLFVTHASWRLSAHRQVYCAWNDSEELIGQTLGRLLGERLRAIIMSEYFDLDLLFESGMRLLVFADVTAGNLGQFEDNWILLTPQHVLTVAAGHGIQVSPVAPAAD